MDTNNKTAEEIVAMYKDMRDNEQNLRESIRHFLSRRLMDTDEENSFELNLTLQSGAMGLSEDEKPIVTSLFQDCEGIVRVKIYGMYEPMELDDVALDWQVEIVENFPKNMDAHFDPSVWADEDFSEKLAECCGKCGEEVEVKHSILHQGFKYTCPKCGETDHFCSVCTWSEDNPMHFCDWRKDTGECWRDRQWREYQKTLQK